MTVNEAIKLLSYGTAYEIKGAYSGKTYHKLIIQKDSGYCTETIMECARSGN